MAKALKITILSLIVALVLMSAFQSTSCKKKYISTACPGADTRPYLWKEAKAMGNGSFQEDWSPGTFPLGITDVFGFEDPDELVNCLLSEKHTPMINGIY